MASMRMKAVKMPIDDSATNRVFVCVSDLPLDIVKHIEVQTSKNKFIFTCKAYPIASGTIGFSFPQRKWAELSLNDEIEVRPFSFNANSYLSSIVVEADFQYKKNTTLEPYDTDKMAGEFATQFQHQAFTVGQQLVFSFLDKQLLSLVVKDLEVTDIEALKAGKQPKPRKTQLGLCLPNTTVVFDKAEGSPLNLVGKYKGKVVRQSIINSDWDFNKMGIGGLDKEFSAIFRRAFASRIFPPEIAEELGCKHVKGILLFGPPGTGKTLMARQIGKMLNTREPKIVNGPQILDKYVGESEANVRRLFADAEEEEKKLGPNSGLHVIIFDEIDAICKARGSVAGNNGVHDTVVNQLLAKLDGVEQLNNILVIGMTNRRDMIDDALMRPGRLELQVEIGLPDESGRHQILIIHTARMRENNKLSANVDPQELAALTKHFTGAELEGLVRAAQSTALNRLIKIVGSKVEVDPNARDQLRVCRSDFLNALENDIKPANARTAELLECYTDCGIINWGFPIMRIMKEGSRRIQQAKSPESRGLVTVLLEGNPNSGKTALAAFLAKNSDFPNLKVISPENMVGFTEQAKCMAIQKIFVDAYRSELSCILVDDVEGLIDYVPIGPRFSNLILQALRIFLTKKPPKGHSILVLCTTSLRQVVEEMRLLSAFTTVLHVANLSTGEHLMAVLEQTNCFTKEELQRLARKVEKKRVWIGIKKLLDLVNWTKQFDEEEEDRVAEFLSKLEEEGALEMTAPESHYK